MPMTPYPPQDAPGLQGCDLDRCSEKRTDTAWLESKFADADWIPVWRYRSAIEQGEARRFRLDELPEVPQTPIFLGLQDDGRGIFCFDASHDDDLGERHRFADLRGAMPLLSSADGAMLAYARAMIYWHRQHRHCGRCGTATRSQSGGHVLWCSQCETEHYPRSDPSMLCLVTDPQDRALLGRKPEWPGSLFSVLAGFAEPGETLEDCVAREIWEESRVRVTGTRYIISQPWPFPASVLFGYLATSQGENPQTAQDELAEARWFSREEVASGLQARSLHIPPPFTLSHFLIATWFDAAGDEHPRLAEVYTDPQR